MMKMITMKANKAMKSDENDENDAKEALSHMRAVLKALSSQWWTQRDAERRSWLRKLLKLRTFWASSKLSESIHKIVVEWRNLSCFRSSKFETQNSYDPKVDLAHRSYINTGRGGDLDQSGPHSPSAY